MDLKTMRERVRSRLTPAASWYDIRNVADDNRAVVRIYDEIGFFGTSADQFARDLATLDADEIEVQINSPGGEVFDGLAIFNALRAHPARITTRVDGLAASAASVIAQAGDERVMLTGSQMMIHEAWGVAIGPASEMREFADLLDKQNDNMAALYAARSGGKAEDFRAKLAEGDTWLSATETVELGLADKVVDPAAKSDGDKAKAAATTLDDFPQRIAALEQALAALQTPPATEREESTEAEAAEVSSEEAERFLASLTLNKEATA